MATQNLTRGDNGVRNQKKGVCVAATTVTYDEILTSGDSYELFVLPENSIIMSASILVKTASNSATSAAVDLGYAGSDVLVDGGNLKSTAGTVLSGGTNAVVPGSDTGTGKTVTFKHTFVGAPTAGEFVVVIEYVEYTKNSGEYTEYSATA